MDVKRIKLERKCIDYDRIEVLISSSITSEICEGLIMLKEKVVNRPEAITLMDTNRSCFLSLLRLFDRLHTKLLSSTIELEDKLKVALRESSSVLANVCHFSVAACAEVSQWSRIATLLLNLLEHQAGGRMKANVLRLVGNLCNFHETSSLVAHNSALLENIALNIKQSDAVIAERSLRVMRLLSRNPIRLKAVILSNCIFHIGSRIARLNSPKELKQSHDILQILLSLVRVYPKDVGRQLVASGCAPVLLDILLYDSENTADNNLNNEKSSSSSTEKTINFLWQNFLLKLTRNSFDLREAFGRDGINRVLDSNNNLNGFRCEFLCHFTQDAWARMVLCEKNVLARMLDLLNSNECAPRQQMKIITSLQHFIYDTQSMALVCQRGGFIRIAIDHIRRFVEENRVDCNQEKVSPKNNLKKKVEEINQEIHESDVSSSSKSSIIRSHSSDVLSAPMKQEQGPFSPERMEEFFCGPLSKGALPSATISPPFPAYNRIVWSPSMSPNNSNYEYNAPNAFTGNAPTVTLERTVEQDEHYLLDDSNAVAAATLLDDLKVSSELADDDISCHSNESTSISDEAACERKIDETTLSTIQNTFDENLDSRSKRLVVADCLNIISKLTHQEVNYPYLVKEEVLRTLIDYISETTVFDPHIMRSLIRLARCQRSLHALLEMNFHWMVVEKLIRRPCILKKFGNYCRRCDRCCEFGRDLMRDFMSHADSNIGWYHIEMGLRNDNAKVVRNALTSGLMLIRSERAQRFHSIYVPIQMLLLDLSRILSGEWQSEKEPPKFSSDSAIREDCLEIDNEQAQICWEIFTTFASLLTRRALRPFFDFRSEFETPQNDWYNDKLYYFFGIKSVDNSDSKKYECLLNVLMPNVSKDSIKEKETSDEKIAESPEQFENDKPEVLEFYNANNPEKGPILSVPKSELCASNPYFKGMFEHEFVEKAEGRMRFMFDEKEDNCDEEDFVKFMHYLVGCRNSECVEITTAKTCSAMILLADKYLCSTLTDELIKMDGIARRIMNGANLQYFLPTLLTIPTVMDALSNTWLFVLLRYSSKLELIETLNYFRANPAAIEWLNNSLQRFLLRCTDEKSINQISFLFLFTPLPLWDI